MGHRLTKGTLQQNMKIWKWCILYCHVVNDRIVKMLESKNFIKPEQIGFRKNCRTSDHIFVVKTLVDKYVQNCKSGSKLYACYIDMKKAFDTVGHDALFLKLQKSDICSKIYNLITSMYSNSSSRVKCKHVLSKSITISQGVYQGNILSPILFNIFINDRGMLWVNRMHLFYLTIELQFVIRWWFIVNIYDT